MRETTLGPVLVSELFSLNSQKTLIKLNEEVAHLKEERELQREEAINNAPSAAMISDMQEKFETRFATFKSKIKH